MKSNMQKRSNRKFLNVYVYITAIVYINFLSCTSLDVFRKDDENSIYHPQPGDSVLIETKSGKFYTSVIFDTPGEYITTEIREDPWLIFYFHTASLSREMYKLIVSMEDNSC